MKLELKIATLKVNREMSKIGRLVDLSYKGTLDTADLLDEFMGNAIGVDRKEVYDKKDFQGMCLKHKDTGMFWYILDNLTNTVYNFLDSKDVIIKRNIETLEDKLAVQFLDYLVSIGKTKEFKQYLKENK